MLLNKDKLVTGIKVLLKYKGGGLKPLFSMIRKKESKKSIFSVINILMKISMVYVIIKELQLFPLQ
jgi:hypothetical protein